jgi:hypothetical protein
MTWEGTLLADHNMKTCELIRGRQKIEIAPMAIHLVSLTSLVTPQARFYTAANNYYDVAKSLSRFCTSFCIQHLKLRSP